MIMGSSVVFLVLFFRYDLIFRICFWSRLISSKDFRLFRLNIRMKTSFVGGKIRVVSL